MMNGSAGGRAMPLSVVVSDAGDEKYHVGTLTALTAFEEAFEEAKKVESELAAKLKCLRETARCVAPAFDEYLGEVRSLGESQALASLSSSTFAMETAIETVSGATKLLDKVLGWALDQRDHIADHIAITKGVSGDSDKCMKRGRN